MEPDLFDWVKLVHLPYNGEAPFQSHSATSHAASAAIKHKIGPLHQRILDYLTVHPLGDTDEGLMDSLALGGNTLRPRRRELQLMGLIKDSERVAYVRSGRLAVVWVKS